MRNSNERMQTTKNRTMAQMTAHVGTPPCRVLVDWHRGHMGPVRVTGAPTKVCRGPGSLPRKPHVGHNSPAVDGALTRVWQFGQRKDAKGRPARDWARQDLSLALRLEHAWARGT